MRLSSFMDALRGLAFMLRTQRHAQIHGAAALVIAAMGWWLKIEANRWCWLVVAMAMVISAEAFNTAIERLADRITTQHDALIGQAKDLGAGAVLCAATGAAIIGFIVLGPPLWARVFG